MKEPIEDLRAYFATHGEEDNYRVAKREAFRQWNERERFCSHCGSPLPPVDIEGTNPERPCPACGMIHFPRIEPCVIIRIEKDGKMLLAKHVQRNTHIYACIAGFIEAGESAEHAVQREIREETGLEVSDIRYFGSQSWPFPDQLMLAFTAQYAGGEIHVQEDELSDAGWFSPDDLPAHPRQGSISWRLIHEG